MEVNMAGGDFSSDPKNQISSENQKLLGIRLARMQDATQLKQPDAIPIFLPMNYLLAELGGVTKQELLENPQNRLQILEKVALEYQPDSISGPFPNSPWPHLALGDRMVRFPGHGLPADSEFQFLEGEFMKMEDYDDLLDNPADFAIRKYLPRAFKELEGLSMIPPLGSFLGGSYNVLGVGTFNMPPVMKAIEAIGKAMQASGAVFQDNMQTTKRMMELGFVPSFVKTPISLLAPFDFMCNTLRGMSGIMMDMFKVPDKLLAAQEKVMRIQLESAIRTSHGTGVKNAMFFLHHGSDGFMSLKHFEKFYWPQLKDLLLALIANDITPYLFYEGTWDSRLEYLATLPKGKTVGWFQNSDMKKVKEILGDVMCIVGGMPISTLSVGSISEVREKTDEVCQTIGKGGGFIMSTTVGEMSSCKPELVKAWVDATREFGKY